MFQCESSYPVPYQVLFPVNLCFSVSQAILYHISELKGMSRNYEKFGVLGLDQKNLHDSVMTAGSFVLKTSELQQ